MNNEIVVHLHSLGFDIYSGRRVDLFILAKSVARSRFLTWSRSWLGDKERERERESVSGKLLTLCPACLDWAGKRFPGSQHCW